MSTPALTKPFDSDAFFKELEKRSDEVRERHSDDLPEKEFAWLTGCLGNPRADVWFIAENPSLNRAREAQLDATREAPTREAQWTISDGDHLFRDMLFKHHFKDNAGTAYSADGWNCYITDVVKSAYIVKEWNAKSSKERNCVAKCWAPVLAWELRVGKPKVVVAVGRRAQRLLKHAAKHLHEDDAHEGPVSLPRIDEIEHYVSIMNFPQGGLPARHPDRIRRWDARFADIRRGAAALG